MSVTDNIAANISDSYWSNFTWRNAVGDYAIAHDDGAVSVGIYTSGTDVSMFTVQQCEKTWFMYGQALHRLDQDMFLEVHHFRESNTDKAEEYIARSKDIVRCHEIANVCRNATYDLMCEYGRSNEVFLCLTIPAKNSFFRTAKKNLIEQAKLAQRLEKAALGIARDLPDGRVISADEYATVIERGAKRDRYNRTRSASIDRRFPLNEQIMLVRPENVGEGIIKNGNTYTKVALLTMYPDADYAAWFEAFASMMNCDTHVTQIIQSVDTKSAMKTAEQSERKAQGLSSNRGAEQSDNKIGAIRGFRRFVDDNDLGIYKSCYIFQLHSTNIDNVREAWEILLNGIEAEKGTIVSSDSIAQQMFLTGQFGQGYKTTFLRPDHELLVRNMMPVITFDNGLSDPSMIRLSSSSEIVGFDYPAGIPNHSFTIAKTGSGKGVAKVAEILETYPLGTNWYIAEVGTSYQWTVEALGGTYIHIDPDVIVVNPFPEYSLIGVGTEEGNASSDSDAEFFDPEAPLSLKIVAPTIKAMSFILLDDTRKMTNHEKAAAIQALQFMYFDCKGKAGAPSFPMYLEALEVFRDAGAENDQQREAASLMLENLRSFLTANPQFKKDDNFSLSSGITCVNLKPLSVSGNDELMIFYLVFIALRYAQLCFQDNQASRVCLDELHEFSRVAGDIIKTLAEQITRMGRKEAGAFDGVSQELVDMELGPAVVNQIHNRSLLYTQDGHDQAKERIPSLPNKAIDIWSSYPDPTIAGLNYRQGIRSVGDKAWDLHFVFPQVMLDISDSSPDILKLKEKIGSKTDDIFERLKLLRELR